MKEELIVYSKAKSPNSEIFRTLRTNIQFMDINKKMKTLLVTSTLPKEGKSWVSSNLSVAFAQIGKRVLLIDADMRKGRQNEIFEINNSPGLSDFLSIAEIDDTGKFTENCEKYIKKTEVKNLSLLSAGSVPPNPSELLVSVKMVKLLEELKNIYDIVIIDGTPCELVADGIILSRIVDSTLLVIGHQITKKNTLKRVIKNIQNVEGNLIGVVLNQIPSKTSNYGEMYYYYGSKQDKKVKLNSKMGKFYTKMDSKIIELENEIKKYESFEEEKKQNKL